MPSNCIRSVTFWIFVYSGDLPFALGENNCTRKIVELGLFAVLVYHSERARLC